ncbi:hypothetical protein ASPACDRAFT_34656 [Aspergillus aculeatus ATCC 16872]|uniref:Endonuclease n=1 Tax=Aspergillus aculeatus (strain ATCC 16872 / CBS 172.66 / WB 5094) TaxID=690307 RepID=A0A1L9WJH2_ASPA1|nr:uncharacterized protein ASPACDRAFT_34656 [Aspergillus aculeatus ATCC 16872]OJJ96312.1 hypothetical protein ASPACDRAFT_34656 [Aspergillus aculeatus ATCC 16872]
MSKSKLANIATIAIPSAVVAAGLTKLVDQQTEKQLQTPSEGITPLQPNETPGLVILPKALPTSTIPLSPKLLSPSPPTPPVDPTGILKYGHPGPVNDELRATSWYGTYDRRTRNPIWVAEHMTPASIANAPGKRRDNFREDPDIPAAFRAKVKDYSASGYDRGHQVPADPARWSQQAVDETFRMSNMCPQVGVGFNRHYWRDFEAFCKNLTTRYPSVRVITGPLYLPRLEEDGKWRVSYEVIGSPSPRVAVPTHFFKVVLGEEDGGGGDGDGLVGGKVAVGAFVLPNGAISGDKPLADFEVELDVLEQATGLELIEKLKSTARRKLCEEVQCDIRVKDFSNAVEEVTEMVGKVKL